MAAPFVKLDAEMRSGVRGAWKKMLCDVLLSAGQTPAPLRHVSIGEADPSASLAPIRVRSGTVTSGRSGSLSQTMSSLLSRTRRR